MLRNKDRVQPEIEKSLGRSGPEENEMALRQGPGHQGTDVGKVVQGERGELCRKGHFMLRSCLNFYNPTTT